MAIEIERKFLVKSDAYKDEAFASSRIIQGYICRTSGRTVRVRLRDGRGWLTIKGPGNAGGLSRFEWEKEISPDEARILLELAQPGIIDKTRYLVKNTDGIHIWEVDEFYGENEGLTVAETELGAENESFSGAEWLGEEVTGDRRYYNSSLTVNPFRNWKDTKR